MANWFQTFKKRLADLTGRTSDRFEDDDQIADPEFEGATTGPLGRLMVAILLFPFQVLFFPLKAIGLFHHQGVDAQFSADYQELSFSQKAWNGSKQLLLGILQVPYLVFTAPIHFFRGLGRTGTMDFIFITPALIMLCLLTFVFVQVFMRSEVIRNRYAKGIQNALANQEYRLAKVYFDRLLVDGNLTQPQQIEHMLVLQRTGEFERANELLDELAPEDRRGFGPAHKIKALQLASLLAAGRGEPDTTERLGRHLFRTGEDSVETLQAWALYYRQIGNVEKAVDSLLAASQKRPDLILLLADYYLRLGREVDYKETLTRGEAVFREILADEPLNQLARINLANLLARQERIDEAQAMLTDGFRIQPDDTIRQALGSFFSMRFDLAVKENESTKQRLDYLIQALFYQPNSPDAYQRMMQMYLQGDKSEEEIQAIKTELQEIIASDKPSEIAHFSLSNILFSEGKKEEAIFHLEQAYQLNPSFVVVLNNLAWMIAHDEKAPDLDRALELANRAIDANPNDARYRDTRGSILLMKKQYKEAITDLQLALRGVSQPAAVHKKLYECYSAIGSHEIAQIHLKNSQPKKENP